MLLNVQKWVLYTVSEKENVYSVYFLVFNQNIEINLKLLKNDFSCKIIFFFVKKRIFLKSCKSPSNIEKRVIYAVLEKKKYCRKIKIKT